eukprot:TRINITY_DN8539_c0_g1_i1.p1 TRINITY_DN8539_c0_g1~~TRINITY_DN8539_c0_g1_i1.p1  ORF type:complete len:209 (-),score=-23.08 TRINITY_DN8539_c0_g1_i1:13-639(-)
MSNYLPFLSKLNLTRNYQAQFNLFITKFKFFSLFQLLVFQIIYILFAKGKHFKQYTSSHEIQRLNFILFIYLYFHLVIIVFYQSFINTEPIFKEPKTTFQASTTNVRIVMIYNLQKIKNYVSGFNQKCSNSYHLPIPIRKQVVLPVINTETILKKSKTTFQASTTNVQIVMIQYQYGNKQYYQQLIPRQFQKNQKPRFRLQLQMFKQL